jgi:hypothetical protein
MGFLRTVRTLGVAATRVSAALSLAFCLNGAIHLCLCDTDPDCCGAPCHDCASDTPDACTHITVQIDAPHVAQTLVDVPPSVTVPEPFFPDAGTFAAAEHTAVRPPSTAPPDPGGIPLSLFVRLTPRS